MLRLCAVPRWNFLCRVIGPGWIREHCTKWDSKVVKACSSLLGTSVTGDALSQATLPIRVGGLGLRSSEWVSPIAFLASYMRAITEDGSLPGPGPLLTELEQCLQYVNKLDPNPRKRLVPGTLELNVIKAFYEPGTHKIQHKLTKALESGIFDSWLGTLGTHDRIRMQSLSQAGTGAWLTAIPREPEYQLSTPHFVVAMRFRLGLPPVNDLPHHCKCGQPMTNDHVVGCKSMARGPLTHRHNQVVMTCARHIRRLGFSVTVEPRDSPDGIPDLAISLADREHFVEISVLHPQAPSHQHGNPIQNRENQKKAKYQQHTQRHAPSQLTVVVLDSYGASGAGVREFELVLQELHQSQGEGRGAEQYLVVSEFKEAVAISLQRGNATALLRGNAESRAARICGRTEPDRRRAGTATSSSTSTSSSASNPPRRVDTSAVQRLVSGALGNSTATAPVVSASSSDPPPRVDTAVALHPSVATAAQDRAGDVSSSLSLSVPLPATPSTPPHDSLSLSPGFSVVSGSPTSPCREPSSMVLTYHASQLSEAQPASVLSAPLSPSTPPRSPAPWAQGALDRDSPLALSLQGGRASPISPGSASSSASPMWDGVTTQPLNPDGDVVSPSSSASSTWDGATTQPVSPDRDGV
jgi:hypothetical protein